MGENSKRFSETTGKVRPVNAIAVEAIECIAAIGESAAEAMRNGEVLQVLEIVNLINEIKVSAEMEARHIKYSVANHLVDHHGHLARQTIVTALTRSNVDRLRRSLS